MRRVLFTGATAMCVAFLAACDSGESAAAQSTTSTSQSLLSSAEVDPENGQTGIPRAGQEAPQIDVASLGYNFGDSEALVRVVEMSDFGCGYCRRFHEETFPELMTEFMDSGMVEWKFMPFITGMFENSLAATEGAECALEQSEELFVAMSDALWVRQADWKQAGDPEPVVEEIAASVGVDMGTWGSCLAEDRQLDRVRGATGLANQLGVRATPTFFIVGYPPVQGALPTELFQDILSSAHAEASKGAGG